MHGRRTAMGFIVAMLVTGSLVAGTSADAKPKPKPRPNLGINDILRVPAQVRAGGHFGVKVMVINQGGAARAKASQVSLHLSRDARKSAGDLNVGRTSVGEIDDWGVQTVPATIDLPESAIGSYYVIACADAARKIRETRENDNCNAGSSTVEVVAPIEGVLTGTLDFWSSEELESGNTLETWSRHAQAEITMEISGRGTDIRVVDDGSSYTWGGDYAFTVRYPECVTTNSEVEERADAFQKPGEQISDLEGRADDPTLQIVDLSVAMEYDITGSITSCGQPPVPYTDRSEYTTGLGLQQVSATDDAIVYEVSSDWTGAGEPSQWDTVEGTLTLTLD
ncbi:CARDB domain-containing protein [Nocardioides sp. SR21]|uniref:CARDB domain-containing protein n=1 Tax=Nocardioides sp. SR21 TaxID=2919501 RepID=UPI001FAA9140|nr:CARDB domain-containing protein [Nocardioides sp. SR21]